MIAMTLILQAKPLAVYVWTEDYLVSGTAVYQLALTHGSNPIALYTLWTPNLCFFIKTIHL